MNSSSFMNIDNDKGNTIQQKNDAGDDGEEDLDAFLTAVESKLRGPFSSLEFAKAVQTHALRGGTVVKYLENLSTVLARTDKVIQSRILIGLLGLEKEIHEGNTLNHRNNITRQLYHLVQQAQTSPTHEQWARIVAGLVQGILFVENVSDENNEAIGSHDGQSSSIAIMGRPCQGGEAAKQLSNLCEDVCSTVQAWTKYDERNSPDMNASFVPYHFSLLPPSLLQSLIPDMHGNRSSTEETGTGTNNRYSHNLHFHVPSDTSILNLDEKLEAQRAKDELDHQDSQMLFSKSKAGASKDGTTTTTTSSSSSMAVLPPGFRPTNLVSKKPGNATTSKTNATTGSSMFMKSNTLSTTNNRHPTQNLLRRKGAAQALVKKTKMSSLVSQSSSTTPSASASAANASTTTATSTTASTTTPNSMIRGRLQPKVGAGGGFASSVARSSLNGKMKMIDISEVKVPIEGGNNKDDPTNGAASSSTTTATSSSLRMSKKRRIMEAAEAAKKAKLQREQQEQKKVQQPTLQQQARQGKTTKDSISTKTIKPPNLPDVPPPGTSGSSSGGNDAVVESSQQQQQHQPQQQQQQSDEDWKMLLQERSNKLSVEERERIQHFFQRRYNPTPEQTLVKMKLHEQRTTDSMTGQEMKETFYLELDYTNFSSRQSRKVKRY